MSLLKGKFKSLEETIRAGHFNENSVEHQPIPTSTAPWSNRNLRSGLDLTLINLRNRCLAWADIC